MFLVNSCRSERVYVYVFDEDTTVCVCELRTETVFVYWLNVSNLMEKNSSSYTLCVCVSISVRCKWRVVRPVFRFTSEMRDCFACVAVCVCIQMYAFVFDS